MPHIGLNMKKWKQGLETERNRTTEMKRTDRIPRLQAVFAVTAVLMLTACGGGQEARLAPSEETEQTVSEATSAAEQEPETASAEPDDGSSAAETGLFGKTSESTAAPEAEAMPETDETYPGTVAAEEQDTDAYYGVMYAGVVDMRSDESGTAVYSLQDLNDPENVWTLRGTDIGDIVAELEKGSQAAFLFRGDMIREADSLEFVAAVPYTAYRIGRAEGVTLNNTMSTFSLQTDGGSVLNFLKDNCRIEEGAMKRNEGDHIAVYYAYSEQEQIYYPLEIFAAER